MSSFLCNYFYADLEAQHLGFLDSPDCLVMRLIDDFLVITLDKRKAIKFVETMHRGVPEYGVQVSREKTLVNFDMELADGAVARVREGAGFPYCGTKIDCQTLDITKDRNRDETAGKDFGTFAGYLETDLFRCCQLTHGRVRPVSRAEPPAQDSH